MISGRRRQRVKTVNLLFSLPRFASTFFALHPTLERPHPDEHWHATCTSSNPKGDLVRSSAENLGSQNTVDRVLSVFATVEQGEGLTAFLLMANVFLLLTAYYIIKPVREALILGGPGAEMKSYAGAGQAFLFILLVPLYGSVASRVNRIRLVNGVTAFFIMNLVVFYWLGQLKFSLGVVFFLWVGLFNLMLVAQFWAFANDIYTQEQGGRLFAIVGIGSSLGAIFGARLAGWLFDPIGAYPMMLVTAGLLAVCMALTNCIHRREKHAVAHGSRKVEADGPLNGPGGFQLILKHRYLLLIALLVLFSNFVNTTGEFILGKTVAQHAKTAIASPSGADITAQAYIGKFYADFFFWVNLMSAGLQMFAVSRIMKYFDIGKVLFFLPLIALGSYTMLAFAPILGFIRVAKIAENSTDYSIQNTARHALFLRTSREAKYKAKTAIDGFFWRVGDALSALLVFIGTRLAFDVRSFAIVNAAMVGVWLLIAAGIVRLRRNESATAVSRAA
jgi:AAA family ATP:ADP antiporter